LLHCICLLVARLGQGRWTYVCPLPEAKRTFLWVLLNYRLVSSHARVAPRPRNSLQVGRIASQVPTRGHRHSFPAGAPPRLGEAPIAVPASSARDLSVRSFPRGLSYGLRASRCASVRPPFQEHGYCPFSASSSERQRLLLRALHSFMLNSSVDCRCCRRDPHDSHSAVRPTGRLDALTSLSRPGSTLVREWRREEQVDG
jgi:hypothetical protein